MIGGMNNACSVGLFLIPTLLSRLPPVRGVGSVDAPLAGGDGDRHVAACSRSTGHGHDRARHAVMPRVTPAQISLAWMLHKNDIVPSPGSRKLERIQENLGTPTST